MFSKNYPSSYGFLLNNSLSWMSLGSLANIYYALGDSDCLDYDYLESIDAESCCSFIPLDSIDCNSDEGS